MPADWHFSPELKYRDFAQLQQV